MRYVLLTLLGLAGGGLLAGTLGGCNPFDPSCSCPEPEQLTVAAGTYARAPGQTEYRTLPDGGIGAVVPDDAELKLVVSADRSSVVETYVQAGRRVENRYEVRPVAPGHSGPVCSN